MKELLLNKGWMISDECHCGGKHRIEYSKMELPGVTFRTYPNSGKWRCSKKGRKIGEGLSASLETFINGLVA
jgi:hypothetical protein